MRSVDLLSFPGRQHFSRARPERRDQSRQTLASRLASGTFPTPDRGSAHTDAIRQFCDGQPLAQPELAQLSGKGGHLIQRGFLVQG